MIPVGDVYKFKTEVEEELTPNFYSALMSSLGKPYPTRFGNAKYVFDITCFTEPLQRFIEDVIKSLKKFGTTPFPLIRGFGFGKTHSLIVLWHLFTSSDSVSNNYLKELISQNSEILKQTFVLGCDVSERITPLKVFADTLFASQKMEKDYDLLRVLSDLEEKYDKNDLLSPTTFADLLINFVKESKKKFGKTPKFLVLIDELGYGTIKRIDEYSDSNFTKEDLIEDIRKLISFVSTIAEELKNHGSSLVIVYAFAEQDIKSLDARIKMYYSNENIRTKLEGLKELIRTDLIERLKRQSGGVERAPLQLNPLQNIEIAKFRVLETIGDENKARDTVSSYIQDLLETFKIFETETDIHNYVENIKRFYPISPDLLNLLKKAHDSTEFPKTEYVRTIMSLLKDAVKNALQNEPNVPLIGVRFLSLQQSALGDILSDYAQSDWFTILKDIEPVIESSKNRKLAELISKLILSKATTSDILALIEERDIEKYGTSQEEIQASIVSTFTKEEVSSALEEIPEIITELRVKSARIIERSVDGKKLFIPSVVKHIIAQKESYVIDERKKAEDKGALIYIRESSIFPLLNKLSKSANILIKDYKEFKELGNIQFNEPTCFIIPPWDIALNGEIEKKGYDSIVKEIANILNNKFEKGEIIRAPYLIVLIPNLSKVDDLVNSLIEYYASIKFLNYLKEEEAIVIKYLQDVKTQILTKRGEKVDDKELSKSLVQSIQQQIKEAKNTAMADVVRCARSVIANLLRLYEKPITYNLTNKSFVSSTRFLEKSEERIKQIVPEIKTKDIDKYSDMIKRFVEDVLSIVGFEEKYTIVAEALLKQIEKELEKYELKNISIEELLENLILGRYGVLPKTEEIARKAIESLNGKTIDYLDNIVKIIVDKKTVSFKYEKKEPKMKIELIRVIPRKLTYSPKEVVRLNICIVNEGAKGGCILKIERCDDKSVVTSREFKEINSREKREVPLELTLPKIEKEYHYKISVMHNPVDVDDEKEIIFTVKSIETPPPPPRFVKEITADITESNKQAIIDFVSSNQTAFEKCEIYMESDDFDISVNVKSPNREDMDVLIRFIQPLAKKCNTVPKIYLKAKHGMLKEEDVKFEANVKPYD